MYDLTCPYSSEKAFHTSMTWLNSANNLLVVGSQNLDPADWTMPSEQIRSMQLIDARLQISAIPFFEDWRGISSVAQHPRDPFILFIANSSEIFEFNLRKKRYELLHIPGIDDVHEISFLDDGLWISNTADDEAVLFDPETHSVAQRIDLRTITPESGESEEIADTFHVNQVFRNFDGDLCALVHHHSGHQEVTLLAEKIVKRQGDGGIVNITNCTAVNLGLKAPHSVRLVDHNYWVFDSGRCEVKVFTSEWKAITTIPTRGFGRGADYSPRDNTFYAGISATRRRYLGLIPRGPSVPNMVQVFDTKSFVDLGAISIPNIEQVNNIYCLSLEVADALRNFSSL